MSHDHDMFLHCETCGKKSFSDWHKTTNKYMYLEICINNLRAVLLKLNLPEVVGFMSMDAFAEESKQIDPSQNVPPE